jgi:hypothetical protein
MPVHLKPRHPPNIVTSLLGESLEIPQYFKSATPLNSRLHPKPSQGQIEFPGGLNFKQEKLILLDRQRDCGGLGLPEFEPGRVGALGVAREN